MLKKHDIITQLETTDSQWFIRMYSNIECNVSQQCQRQIFFWPTLSSHRRDFHAVSVVFRAMILQFFYHIDEFNARRGSVFIMATLFKMAHPFASFDRA
ncbi:hypothetical protein T02_10512 [Trichinella nativa]|uniref:Uncharacterized protein n=1 Tax=Trichinella nativa TaxID=6335 RepID=A0A0V1KR34_9BILA|nr:hypothetical protein T02_10512 [Trichinella nativa]